MYKPVQVIEVRIWGKTVGAVALARNLGYYAFEYDSRFVKSGIELAPAYDVTYAFNPAGEWTFQHLMAVNGKFTAILRSDLLAVADRFGIGTAPKVLKQVREAVAAWPDFAVQAGLKLVEMNRIREQHALL